MKKRIVHVILVIVLCNSFLSFSQEQTTTVVQITEEQEIEFQENFFKALSEKAIRNYQKAIEYLENCNQILPENKAVLFELSKNYLKLRKTFEAEQYVVQALKSDPKNVWMLEHLVLVYKRERNFKKAITIQKKIGEDYPKKKQQLVFLYIQNQDYDGAREMIEELAKSKLLNARLRRLQATLALIGRKTTKPKVKPTQQDTKTALLQQFEKEKSFKVLQRLLSKLEKGDIKMLLRYSQQGMELFPAQPFVYLMHGMGLNKQKQFKEALQVLQNGIDFVIDNNQLKQRFYKEMVLAYEGLGNVEKAKTYRKKIK